MTTSPLLGVVTIGQSPRPDLERAFRHVAPDLRVHVAGALDDLSAADIDALAARATTYPLLVRLRDGRTAAIGLEVLHPLVARRVAELADAGARAIVIACAGDFPDCPAIVPVILPGRELPRAAAQRAPRRRVGIVTPIDGQAAAARAKWTADGFTAIVTSASPAVPDEIRRAAGVMREADVDLVVLDCMGHEADQAAQLAALCGHPVITAQAVAADAAARRLSNEERT